jgi:3-hydroxyacyl-CoA dehydrogenase
MEAAVKNVAVVGAGVIGRSWMQVFARAGCHTRVYDRDSGQTDRALGWMKDELELDVKERVVTAAQASARLAQITPTDDLGEALRGVGYVQESGPEDLSLKRVLYREMDSLSSPRAILASSTSAISITEITDGLGGGNRCIIAHPVNPPHVIPVVEVLGGERTDPEVIKRTKDFLASVGQRPVVMRSYVPGFLLNRMQTALLREAINLLQSGVAELADIDATISEGLGLRWAILGPFGVAQTNADGGVREYFARYRQTYLDIASDLRPFSLFDDELVEKLGQGMDAMLSGVPASAVRRRRDRLIRQICTLKLGHPTKHTSQCKKGKSKTSSK